jgi:hypothetical protein
MHSVSVHYRYIGGPSNANGSSTICMSVYGRSESAVIHQLRNYHPGCEIIILDMDWND